jgi:hypothetical protein
MPLYQKAFIKTLTASDIDPLVSNQHELHGVKQLENIFGTIPSGQSGNFPFNATIKIGNSGAAEPISFTWYNSRASTPHRHEYRLYYTTNNIVNQLSAGDDLLIGQTPTGRIEAVVFKQHNENYNVWTPIVY